ncbi:tyrosine-type recombinase/integrase [Amycolatopsis jejuensis]|uniref:tyrosine-type recombinase/integrase n=1 Tax=Amycolatopsis jejuensis TaxID=330084 RepID=UPI0006902721|nr:tyrosine-type recombinase/integrase [Amycolatopsis jejuensis]
MSTDIDPAQIRRSHSDDLSTAQLLLQRLNVSPLELTTTHSLKHVPTFAEYVPVVAATVSPSSENTWRHYWAVLVDERGGTRLDEPTASDLGTLANIVQQKAARRGNSRDGQGAKSTFVDAVRVLYNQAVYDKLIEANANPAAHLKRPRRHRSLRRALSHRQLCDINHVATTTGNDPHLDALLIRLHTETACRRGGALALRPIDLNHVDYTIRLREKGGTTREQPISPTLMTALTDHTTHRNPAGTDVDRLLRTRTGTPMQHARYDALWARLGRHLPWINAAGVTAHWLRYTTLTWVERNFGYAVAAAYAGHAAGFQTGTTLTYVSATIEELATALAALTGEPHPLAA